MKIKILTIFTALLFFACSEDAIKPWESGNYIHFSGPTTNYYSFVYAGSDVEQDTISLRLSIAGNMVSEDRTYKIRQVKSYGFIYEKDELGNILDSTFIELPNQAEAGKHFVDFNTDENQEFIVPANSLGVDFNLIVLRDSSLKENDYILSLEVVSNEDFLQGNHEGQKVTITLSDQISRPFDPNFKDENGKQLDVWDDFLLEDQILKITLKAYGKKKHQILIDATKQKWDGQFITNSEGKLAPGEYLTAEYLLFYKSLAIERLNEINAERNAKGLHNLREDDANPNSEVTFL